VLPNLALWDQDAPPGGGALAVPGALAVDAPIHRDTQPAAAPLTPAGPRSATPAPQQGARHRRAAHEPQSVTRQFVEQNERGTSDRPLSARDRLTPARRHQERSFVASLRDRAKLDP